MLRLLSEAFTNIFSNQVEPGHVFEGGSGYRIGFQALKRERRAQSPKEMVGD